MIRIVDQSGSTITLDEWLITTGKMLVPLNAVKTETEESPTNTAAGSHLDLSVMMQLDTEVARQQGFIWDTYLLHQYSDIYKVDVLLNFDIFILHSFALPKVSDFRNLQTFG
jgi:hypothetical protein